METGNHPESDIAKILKIDKASVRGGRWKKWLTAASVTVLLVIVAGVASTRQKAGRSNPVRYKTQAATRGDLEVTVTATGTLQPTKTVQVGSELSGIIKSVEVDYNDNVKTGQVLARVDTSKLEAQVTQTKAALKSAEAKVLQTQATVAETLSKLGQLQKVQKLSDNKIPSQAELEAAKAAFERAKAEEAGARASVSQAQATLQVNETDLSKAIIRAPIDGIVLSRDVDPGQTVVASFQTPELFVLAQDLTQMELQVDVDEADIGQVKKGQSAVFSVDAYPNRTFEARITQARYNSKTVNGVVTYTTVLKVNNPDLALRPGMTATAVITVKRVEKALLVPNGAFRFAPPVQETKKPASGGGVMSAMLPHPPPMSSSNGANNENADRTKKTLYILKDGKPVAVTVTAGSTSGAMTEILDGGLEPGTAIIVDTITTGKQG